MTRIGEICRLCKTHAVKYSHFGTTKRRVTFLSPKKATQNYPDQFVTINEIPNAEFCPIAAWDRALLQTHEEQHAMFCDKNGKPLTSNKLSAIWRDLIQEWRAFDPDAPQEGKLSFHTLRISSIGHHAIDLNLSIFEVQAISRHAFGSSVTEQVYLARSSYEMMKRAADKVTAAVDPLQSNTNPDLQWMDYLPASAKHIFQTWHSAK